MVGTIAGLMNIIITPIVSYRSDRHRGRWGRRIPYLLWPTPFITLFLIMVGFSTDIGNWLYTLLCKIVHVSPTTVILWTVGVCSVLFQFFNMFVASVYFYLFNDVVPEQFLGRFYAFFRLTGACAGFVFNYFILKYAGPPANRQWIYVAVGLIYLISFLLMCWRVKEGDYPPPPEPVTTGDWMQRLTAAVCTYVRECYSLPYYWWFYLGTALYTVADVCILTFRIFFAKELGMTLAELGKLLGAVSVVGVVLYWPLGWLADKIHSLRLNIIAVALTLLVVFPSSWMIHDKRAFWVLTLAWSVAWTAYKASNAPMFPQLLPKELFGQFASAQVIFGSIAIMIANYLGGLFLDYVGRFQRALQYRAIYWWASFFSASSLAFMFLVYRGWKHYGGMKHYTAPVVVPGGSAGNRCSQVRMSE
jgi:MFS family permease